MVDLDALNEKLIAAGIDSRVRHDDITDAPRLLVVFGDGGIHVTEDGQVMARSQSFRWARITKAMPALRIIDKHLHPEPNPEV